VVVEGVRKVGGVRDCIGPRVAAMWREHDCSIC